MTMDSQLQGRSTLVTGGGRGLGEAISRTWPRRARP